MIIRALRLRHGRLALPKPSPSIHLTRRAFASETTTSTETRTDTYSNPFGASESNSNGATAAPSTSVIRSHDAADIRNANHPVAVNWALSHHQKAVTSHLGSDRTPHYRPGELLANPPSPKDITLELLMASEAHLGHATSRWNPANARYIFGVRGDHDPVHIISLDVTASHLRRACRIVHGVAARGGNILFVGTRAGQARAVVKAAEMARACHLFTKWIPGSITNGQQILGMCGKKVVDQHDVEVLGFQDQLAASAVLKPDLVICLNPRENYVLLHECGLHNVPTIGIIDTDADPTWVTYPIPANDDSLRCVQVVAGTLGCAGQQGHDERLAQAKRGHVATTANHRLQPPRDGQAAVERETIAREAALRQLQISEVEEASRYVELPSEGEDDQEAAMAFAQGAAEMNDEAGESTESSASPVIASEAEAEALEAQARAARAVEADRAQFGYDADEAQGYAVADEDDDGAAFLDSSLLGEEGVVEGFEGEDVGEGKGEGEDMGRDGDGGGSGR